MTKHFKAITIFWILFVPILAGSFFAPLPATAGDLDQLDASLKLIPQDAAFYSAMLRNREQIEAIGNSQAWKKLMAMPVVQQGLMMYRIQADDPDSVPAQIESFLNDPENRDLIDMVTDMGSNEVFIYGDESFVGFVNLMQQIMGTSRFGPLMAQATGEAQRVDPAQLQVAMLLNVLADNRDLVRVPDLIIGFKLTDVDRAKAQLQKLEMIATMILGSNPQMQGRFQSKNIGGYDYMTLTLDGTMIPWNEVRADQLPIEPRRAQRVIDRLKKQKLVVALGIRDEYLLLSIGSSTDTLAALGSGPLLANRAELKPLGQFTDRRLVSISYMSKAMHEQLATTKEKIDGMKDAVDMLLPMAPLTPDQLDRIRQDVAALAADIRQGVPEVGAIAGVHFLSENGIEGYQYDYGESKRLDGSKPLGLMQHVGGSPLLAAIARGINSPEDYDLMVKWLTTGWGYFEDFALPQMPPDEREQFEKFLGLAAPLVHRIDKANRDMLIPATADGQAALVIDTKLKSQQFHQALPRTEEAMPMVEPAIVIGVSDAPLFLAGMTEYWAVVKELPGLIREMDPRSIPPDFQIPDPEAVETDNGTVYEFVLPGALGLDPQIAPNLGIGKSVAVFSMSRAHTVRLLKATPLEIGGVLSDPSRNRATAVMFDFAGLIDAAGPWVDLAIDSLNNEFGYADDSVRDQVHTAIEILKVFRSITSESYLENGATVTHSLLEVRDIEQ